MTADKLTKAWREFSDPPVRAFPPSAWPVEAARQAGAIRKRAGAPDFLVFSRL